MMAATSSSDRVPLNVGMTLGNPFTTLAPGSRIDSRMYPSSASMVGPSASATFRPKSPLKVGPTFGDPSTEWQPRHPDVSRSCFPRAAVGGPVTAAPAAHCAYSAGGITTSLARIVEWPTPQYWVQKMSKVPALSGDSHSVVYW